MRWRGRSPVGGLVLGFAVLASCALVSLARAETTLRVALHSDLKIIDPVWTTALISTHHGMMVYDTLFALDEKLQPKPQMVDAWTLSVNDNAAGARNRKRWLGTD